MTTRKPLDIEPMLRSHARAQQLASLVGLLAELEDHRMEITISGDLGRRWAGGDADGIVLTANIKNPDQLESVFLMIETWNSQRSRLRFDGTDWQLQST